jgi:hypothetical protein
MNINTFYYLHGIRPYNDCYYTPGICIHKIPLNSFQSVRLEKMTIVGTKSHTHDFLPSLRHLQRRFRYWYRWHCSIQTLRQREVVGPLPPPEYGKSHPF